MTLKALAPFPLNKVKTQLSSSHISMLYLGTYGELIHLQDKELCQKGSTLEGNDLLPLKRPFVSSHFSSKLSERETKQVVTKVATLTNMVKKNLLSLSISIN